MSPGRSKPRIDPNRTVGGVSDSEIDRETKEGEMKRPATNGQLVGMQCTRGGCGGGASARSRAGSCTVPSTSPSARRLPRCCGHRRRLPARLLVVYTWWWSVERGRTRSARAVHAAYMQASDFQRAMFRCAVCTHTRCMLLALPTRQLKHPCYSVGASWLADRRTIVALLTSW